MTDNWVQKLSSDANAAANDPQVLALLEKLKKNPTLFSFEREKTTDIGGEPMVSTYICIRVPVTPPLSAEAAAKQTLEAVEKLVDRAQTTNADPAHEQMRIMFSHNAEAPLFYTYSYNSASGCVEIRSGSQSAMEPIIHKQIKGAQRDYLRVTMLRMNNGIFRVGNYLADNGVNFPGSSRYKTPELG